MTNFKNMLNDNSGAAAAEYALILAIVGAAIAFAALNLGSAVKNAMDRAATCVANKAPTNATC